MNEIRNELQAIALALNMEYVRAISPADLNETLQGLTITKPLLILANVPEAVQPEVNSNFKYNIYRVNILALDKNLTPDPEAAEIDTLLDNLEAKVNGIRDYLDRSEIVFSASQVEFISLTAADNIELTDEVISGWELVLDIPIARTEYYCNV